MRAPRRTIRSKPPTFSHINIQEVRFGAAVLVVSNEVRMLTHGGVADRLVILHQGRVLAAGTTAELGKSTDTFVRTLLRSTF
ncbi:hypothetical protein [Nocardia fluminea]|uniref:hypothetical protein n=1 Tax=Nocardia fluminea TaxID=134984 RepID=UPI00343B2D1A